MLIDLLNVGKRYQVGAIAVPALVDISLQIASGEDVAIVGPSGSGKSTLLSLLGCLDTPTSGRYRFAGAEVETMSRTQLAHLRNRRIGFVFQSFNLLPRLTAQQNVELPLIYAGCPKRERLARSRELLRDVGLEDRGDHFPSQLSGGQQQRVAIARALANRPEIILADEPTGALDLASGRMILDVLQAVHRGGTTLAVVTHDAAIAARTSRTITLVDGVVRADLRHARETGDVTVFA